MHQDRTQLLRDTNNETVNTERGRYEALDDSIHDLAPSSSTEIRVFPQYIAAVTATLSSLCAGMVLGWTSPILNILLSGKFNDISISTAQMGWVGSFTTLGAMSMCIPTGFICDLIGRKRTLLSSSVPFIAGWILILYSNSLLDLYLGRLIVGMGFGACSVAAPIYISEISHKVIRGALGSLFQLMISIGILVSYIAGTVLTPHNFTLFCAAVPILFIILFSIQPESPVFLMRQGLCDEAKCSLIVLRGAEVDVTQELSEIEGVLKESGQTATSIVQTFRRQSNRKALLIIFSLFFFQQFCGINAVILYSTDIFETSGLKINDDVCAIVLGVIQVVATLFSTCVVDKLGRRALMLCSTFIAGLSTLALAIYFTLKNRFGLDNQVMNEVGLGYMPIVSLGLFMVMFSIGLGPLPWVIGSEIFPPEAKSIACSGAATFALFLAFLITKFFLQVSDSIGEDTSFYIFTFSSFLGAAFSYFILPETKGKTIEDIQFELSI